MHRPDFSSAAPRLALALALWLGTAGFFSLHAQNAESFRSAVTEAKMLLGQPGGAEYEKRVGATIQKLPFADALRDCLRRNREKAPDLVNVVLVIGLDGSVRDALFPANDSVSDCVSGWMSAQKDLPTPPRDAWMVHIQVKLRP